MKIMNYEPETTQTEQAKAIFFLSNPARILQDESFYGIPA